MDQRTRRDGRQIEVVGLYDPLVDDHSRSTVVNEERIKHWLSVGAQPSETVVSILRKHQIALPGKAPKKSKKVEQAATETATQAKGKAKPAAKGKPKSGSKGSK